MKTTNSEWIYYPALTCCHNLQPNNGLNELLDGLLQKIDETQKDIRLFFPPAYSMDMEEIFAMALSEGEWFHPAILPDEDDQWLKCGDHAASYLVFLHEISWAN